MALPRQSNFNKVFIDDLIVKNNLTVLGTETITNQVINQNSIAVDEITHRNTTVLAVGNTATTQVTVDGTLVCNDTIEATSDLTVAGSSKFDLGVDTDTIRPIAPATEVALTGDLEVSGDVGATTVTTPTITTTIGDLTLNPTGNVALGGNDVTGATNITATGTITGGVLTDGTATLTGGNISTTGTVNAGGFNEGTVILSGGEITTTATQDLSLNPTGANINCNNKTLTNVGGISISGAVTVGNIQVNNTISTPAATDLVLNPTADIDCNNNDLKNVKDLDANSVQLTGGNMDLGAGNLTTTGTISGVFSLPATGLTTSGDITSTGGNISATVGNVSAGAAMSAGTTITAGTGLTVTSGNLAVSGGTITAGTGLTVTFGNLAVSGGNITSSGSITAGSGATVNGGNLAVSGGNVTVGGNVTATGNVTGGTVTASGTVQGGTLTDGIASINAGSISGATSITASGAISGNSLALTGGNITTGNGNIDTINGNISISGSGNVVVANGDLISTNGNVNALNGIIHGNILQNSTVIISGGQISTVVGNLNLNAVGTDINCNNKNLINVGTINGRIFPEVRTGNYLDSAFDSALTTNRFITIPFASPMTATDYTVSIIPRNANVTEIMYKTNNGAHYISSKTLTGFTIYIGGYTPGGGGIIPMSFDWMAIRE